MDMRALLLVAVGCSAPPCDTRTYMDAEGGMVIAPDGASITVPPQTLPHPIDLCMRQFAAAPPPGTVVVGPGDTFSPDDGPLYGQVTIALPFDAARIPAGLTADDIFIYTTSIGTYLPIGSRVSGDTVTVLADRLGPFFPAVPAAPCTPTCVTGRDERGPVCVCSAGCNGSLQVVGCSGFGGSPLCICQLDHQTVGMPPLASCDQVAGAFAACFH